MAAKPLPAMPAYELAPKDPPRLVAPIVVKGDGQNTYRMPSGMSGGHGNQNDAGPCGDICPGC